MKPDARLRLNSVGKLWTATLILKLVGEGRLKLDDTASHWLPGLLPYGNQITVAQLLSMTSGMLDTNDFSYATGGPAAPVIGDNSSYGLGVVIQPDGCATPGVAYGHNGGGDGDMSSVQVSPNGSRVAVVLVNGYATSSAAQDRGGTKLSDTMQRLYCTAP